MAINVLLVAALALFSVHSVFGQTCGGCPGGTGCNSTAFVTGSALYQNFRFTNADVFSVYAVAADAQTTFQVAFGNVPDNGLVWTALSNVSAAGTNCFNSGTVTYPEIPATCSKTYQLLIRCISGNSTSFCNINYKVTASGNSQYCGPSGAPGPNSGALSPGAASGAALAPSATTTFNYTQFATTTPSIVSIGNCQCTCVTTAAASTQAASSFAAATAAGCTPSACLTQFPGTCSSGTYTATYYAGISSTPEAAPSPNSATTSRIAAATLLVSAVAVVAMSWL